MRKAVLQRLKRVAAFVETAVNRALIFINPKIIKPDSSRPGENMNYVALSAT
jgi:hypothetical protein